MLDVMLPDYDGFEVVRRLRALPSAAPGRHLPVLFLTARDGVQDKIMGLTVGGDDYVTKPFSLEEVVARIRAVLRRTYAGQAAGADDSVLRFADLEMDEETHDVRRSGGDGRIVESYIYVPSIEHHRPGFRVILAELPAGRGSMMIAYDLTGVARGTGLRAVLPR